MKVRWLIGILVVTAVSFWGCIAWMVIKDLQFEKDRTLTAAHSLSKSTLYHKKTDNIASFTDRNDLQEMKFGGYKEKQVISIDQLLNDLQIEP
ncbi:hypothetical protein [Virgibacillus senegalensis]|uniref:hypothetical protein n=1 Tax=Virgibacillus senegalensis TaxID=1499679 RepID=UPI00069FA346|nr:hypothetical protein [Virgibacillus senegalensis]